MNFFLKNFFRFLGSVHCALVLIAIVTLFVIFGTFVESATESHRFASHLTYSNPIFLCLLGMFFVNILFSALLRWPFRMRHIPFLITHFGLLILLSGVIIKALFGIQGTMTIVEGSAANQILLPHTYAIRIEKRANPMMSIHSEIISEEVAIQRNLFQRINPLLPIFSPDSPFFGLKLQLLEYSPHSQEQLETWIKDDNAVISGIPPFQILHASTLEAKKPIPFTSQVRWNPRDPPWRLYALKSSNLIESDTVAISKRLYAQAQISQTPMLAWIQDPDGDIFFWAISSEGKVHEEIFRADHLHSLFSLDRGFGGYGVQITLPPNISGQSSPILLETTLKTKYRHLTPLTKLEENIPQIVLLLNENGVNDKLALAYDRYGTGFKWPALNGKYRIRFQPIFETIPYRLRLRNARQINYPHSQQPYSYEADLIIRDTMSEKEHEVTLSMNHVFETWDGYRFYLSNISSGAEFTPRQVQIVVNRDPSKYFLTYPGAVILTMGIFLLFWLRPYRSLN